MRLPDIALRGFKDVDRLGNVTIIKAPYYGGCGLRFGEMRKELFIRLVIKEGGCHGK